MALITATAQINGSGSLTSHLVRLFAINTNSPINGSGSFSGRLIRVAFEELQIVGSSAVSALQIKLVSFISYVSGSSSITADLKKYKILRCSIKGTAEFSAYRVDREIFSALKSYLPPFLQITSMEAIRQSNGIEFTKINALIEDIKNQFFVDTATWGLDLYEKERGIETIPGASYQERRDKIKAKMQSSQKTMTKARVKELMDIFYTCEIKEFPEVGEVEVTIVGMKGIPDNLQDMEKLLLDYLPAHLTYRFRFTYLLYMQLAASAKTYDQIKAVGLTYDQYKTWTPV